LFEKVEQHRKTGSLITSNTSGIPIEMMLEGRSEDFAAHFCGTHFFNPPRYLKLLEIIPSSKTKPEVIDFFLHYGDLFLGKTTVLCKDTPAFIANRIGVFSIMAIFKMMQKHGLSIEAVDTITGPISGRPKSATFRTSDLVGLDTLVKVAQGVGQNCSQDEMKDWFAIPEFLNKMLKNNWLGDKTGQGFYKKSKDSKGNRTIEALDLQTLEYKPQDKPRYDSIGKAKQANRLKSKLGILYDGGDAAADFYQQAIADEDAFISNYRNKAVSINGEIIEITGSGIQMAPGILLSTLENSGAVALGDVITCKGRMVGIEEDLLTGDLLIRLDECSCD
jgi:3-hydroxyacyl-CoA dehydrogenase